MTRTVILIYNYLRRHRAAAWLIFATSTALLLASTLTLGYSEDIRDFLPFGDNDATAMEVYQDITGANRVYAVVSGPDTDALTDAVDDLAVEIARRDTTGLLSSLTATVDDSMADSIIGAAYRLMPLLLTDADYDRIDSLLALPDLVDSRIAADADALRFPVSGMAADHMRHDPLGLFAPVMIRLRDAIPVSALDTSDGYILSADGTEAFIMMESSSGANESGHNSRLVDMLDDAGRTVTAGRDGVSITFTGAPVVAVGNARCIRHDSLWSILAAGIVIMALLIYVFRSARNIALIFVSVAWGWLFAMGAIALCCHSVSIIVMGIASVMLGIAVNYPLHLVDHLSGHHDRRRALSQIVAPLVVGNVTTVGAFLCLVPLDAPALHDLGLFSSLLLGGTIIFVLIFLPHAVKTGTAGHAGGFIGRLAAIDVRADRRLVWAIALITALLAVFSTRTMFDPDLRNINYLTDDNRALLDRMASVTGTETDGRIYAISTGATWEEAVEAYAASRPATEPARSFLVPRREQQRRLARWNSLASRRDTLVKLIGAAASRNGFSDHAFDDFALMLSRPCAPAGPDDLRPLLLTASVSITPGRIAIADITTLPDSADRRAVLEQLRRDKPQGTIVFDVTSMNEAITGSLAGDFNYIGVACGCIVFLFLWLSMGRMELAAVSFLPMAVSWVWILGIMGLLDIHFNIVNIILATFIFGQGDDYTIFVTEGLSYELAYGRKVVAGYKSSIIVSALIMFAGIGVLAFAEHPAMRSLGQVAVIGMIVVVVMAYVIPPIAFGFLTRRSDGSLRTRPLTLRVLWLNILSHFCRDTRPGVTVSTVCLGDGPDTLAVGAGLVQQPGDSFYHPGHITLLRGIDATDSYSLEQEYLDHADVCRFVADRYLYKGREVRQRALSNLKALAAKDKQLFLRHKGEEIHITDNGQGELALIMAVYNPLSTIYVEMPDEDSLALMRQAYAGMAHRTPGNIFGSVFVTPSNTHT